ncbi:MAG: DNA-directed RNA polymerase subunit alpha C-terminal domain-containing protein [Anaerolineales bacterium]|nr:DNA-directed RNA polymerase subunit alpha C-terminal domain-containing protein [Anaerolineales bacterium]
MDRFYKKLEARQEYLEEQRAKEEAKVSPELPVTELELGTRIESTLEEAEIEIVGQVLERLEEGDSGLLQIDGFGRKSLADLKRALKHRGYELPEAAEEPDV